MTRLLLIASLLLSLAAPARAANADANSGVRLRRFALLIGINDGGAARARLRYATSDARSMAKVLENLGGVSTSDLVFVEEPSRAATLAGFARVDALMRASATPGVRRELLVYYSGHSDEDGLLVGNDRITYDELRARIKQLPADLRVAILDSCASGAFTRGKGGVRRPPFLVDSSADMRGHAFLTSSAANEVAQESDRIAASFFTHYLVSGLRGAADVNQDHRVTLQEAYQFASAETLARTERTKGGPQHAAYEFDLAGTGDMVVTDVRTTQASLVLTPDLAGRITIREADGTGVGALVAELRKPAGNTIELGVEAGSYVIAMEAGNNDGTSNAPATIFETKTTLVSGQRAELARLAFHPGKPLELAMARGNQPPADVVTAPPGPPHTQLTTKLGVIPRPGDDATDVHGFAFSFAGDRAARVDGFQFGLGWTQTLEHLRGVQLAIGATVASGDSRGLQLADGVTYADGFWRGAQLGGIAALTRGDGHGAQVAGIAALADGSYSGVQIGGVTAAARQGSGLQLAGVVDAAEDFTGLQLAGAVNYARRVRGMQLSTVNVAGDAGGFRLGVVNVARETRGFQFGVVNVAKRDDGESFALLNFIGNGIHDVTAYASDVFATNLELKLGGRHLYTALGAGYQPGDALATGPQRFGRATARWGPSVGIGWRFPVEAGRLEHLDLEAHTSNLFEASPWGVDGDSPGVSSLRLVAGVRIIPHVKVIGGVSANVSESSTSRDVDLSWGGPQITAHDGSRTVRVYPGLLAGLEI
ncbi:MAG TPA: caspase family protein [Polyangia bacterium]|nr:caspase family protein [Polyangia bacterium]